jgi:hypothetical protein
MVVYNLIRASGVVEDNSGYRGLAFILGTNTGVNGSTLRRITGGKYDNNNAGGQVCLSGKPGN